MRYSTGILILVLLTIFLFSCSGYQSNVHSAGGLDLNWQVGDTWVVGVKFWPRRLANPHSSSDSYVYKKWRYRVVKADAKRGYRVEQYSGSDTYLLSFSPRYELLEVRHFLQRVSSGVKYKTEKVNQLGDQAFFYLPSKSHPPLIWYHPSIYALKDEMARFNFDLRSSRGGDWVLQYSSPSREGYKITLLHEPSKSNIYFFWNLDKPWWEKVVWRCNKRVVATAELL